MDLHVIKSALRHYEVGQVYDMNPIRSGNSSAAVKVNTEQGTYIIRILKNAQQGEMECGISFLMKSTGLCPEIIPSINGEGYIIEDNKVMNLQRYIEQEVCTLTKEHLFNKLGETTAVLHSTLYNVSLPTMTDRFSIQSLWDRIQSTPIDSEILKKLRPHISFCNELEQQTTSQVIHGDLGVWNLLFRQDSVFIIDYGEARRGNIHFDIAGLLSSILKSSEQDAEIKRNILFFEQSYNRIYPKLTLLTLYDYMVLWTVRGICALIVRYGVNERTSSYMKKNVTDLQRFHSILT